MKEQLKNILSIFLRFGLSIGLLVWLFSKIDYVHMWQAVKGSDWHYMLLAGIVAFLLNFLILWRWRILMKALGLKVGRFNTLRWFFIGLFYNLCLPTSVG